MNLPGYHLNKEGPYYYIYMDRATASFQALGTALSNRLFNINNRGPVTEMVEGEGALKCPHMSGSVLHYNKYSIYVLEFSYFLMVITF